MPTGTLPTGTIPTGTMPTGTMPAGLDSTNQGFCALLHAPSLHHRLKTLTESTLPPGSGGGVIHPLVFASRSRGALPLRTQIRA